MVSRRRNATRPVWPSETCWRRVKWRGGFALLEGFLQGGRRSWRRRVFCLCACVMVVMVAVVAVVAVVVVG